MRTQTKTHRPCLPPEGWPRYPIFNEPGDVPGPPIQYGPPVKPLDAVAGMGFVGNKQAENDQFFYHPDHLGSTSYITGKNGEVSQHVEYIAFGEILFEEHSSSVQMPYLFNGKELDRETNLSYFGARYLDMKTSLWLTPDPKMEKYPAFSPYNYCMQNPIKFVDPDGKDVILVIWATANGQIGHAGIAISNYKPDKDGKMVPDGTYTFKDLWPGGPDGAGKGNFNKNIEGKYKDKQCTLDDLQSKDVTDGGEERPAEGLIEFKTGFELDQSVIQALNEHQINNPEYNGLTNNCSDFAKAGVEVIAGEKLKANERLTDKVTATTPNALYQATSKLPNANILKKENESQFKNGFIKTVGGSLLEGLLRSKIDKTQKDDK